MRTTKRLYRKYHVRQAIMYFLAVWTIFATVPFAWADVNPASNALPNGILPGTTVGAGNFDRTVLNKLTINNVQNGAVVNWNNFDIGSAATVQINQASASAAMLNRVFDGNPTGIMGTLNANGRVFIINPAGVLFGAGSSVNVNQLIASSLNLTDAAFLNGINTGQFNFEGGIPGVDPSQKIGIINNGTITGTEGIALIGQKILNNGAIVTSNGGCVVMAAGDKVVLSQPGSKVIVEMASSTSDIEGAGSVVNNTTGSITSPGGQIVLAAGDIYSAALNNDSKAVKVDGGNGRVGQFGTINAGSGSVSLTAGDVVALGSDSKTTANAGTNGDGGEIVAYSPDTALFHDGAVVEAKGGSQSGNGGFFELSGKEYVEVEGQIDLTAQNGQFGTFLIDPRNITISGGSNNHGSIPSSGAPRTWSPTGSNATLNIDSLESYLGSSNVIVSTAVSGSDSGWIKLDAGRNLVYGGSNYLTLKADDYILINSGINFSGSGNVTLDAVTNITTNAAISLNSGLFTAHAGNSTTDSSAGILSINQNITAGSILLTAGNQNGFDSGTCRVYVGYAPVSDEEYHPGTGTFSNVSLTSTLGDIVVRAIHDIFIGGNVQSAGKISLTGDVEGAAGYPEFGGDIITKGNVTASGGVDYMANAIAIGGNVSANGGNLVIEGRSSKDSASAADDPRGTILDPGAEWGDITVASGGKLYASGDVSIIDYSIDHYSKPASVGKMKLTGNTLLTIQAGNKITAPDTVISVTGSTLVMQQGASLNTADYLFANQANTNLTLISDNGSVTSTTGANAADKWHSIGATADSDITLSGNGSITLGDSGTDATKSLWAKNGNINVTAAGAGNDILATKDLTAGSALTVEADRDITLGGAVTTSVVTNGDLKIDADADTDSSGNIHAKSTITNMGGKIDISGVEVDLDGAVKAKNDILVSGVSGGDMGHVNAYGPLTSENGKIDVFSDWYINLYGAVDAYTDLILKADTSMYGDSHINAYSTLTAQTGNMEISAEGSENLQVSVKLGDVVTAGKNMTLNADLDNYGFGVLDAQELIAGGSINIYSSDSTTNLHDDVTAGADIILHNNTEADGGIKLDAGQDVILADGKTLTGNGALTVEADRHITLGGPVQTTGFLGLYANNDYDSVAGGDLWAKSSLNSGGYLYAYGNNITIDGPATSKGDMILHANNDGDSSGNMHAKSTITTNMGGKIDISGVEVDLDGAVKAEGDILVSGVSGGDMGHVNAYGPLTSENGKIDVFSDWYINLYGAVDAYTDLILKADTSMYGDSHINAYSTLTAQTGNMEISAEGSENLQVSVKLGDVVTAGKNMTLNADLDNYGFGVLDAQELIAGGSINIYSSDSTTNLHDDVTAGADIILHNNTEADGGIKLDAGQDAVLADGKTLNGLGDLTVKAGHDVILGGDVTTVKDMTLNAGNDMIAKSNLTSTNGSIDIYSSDSTTYLGGDWVEASDNVTLNNNTKLNGNANQRIEAINGRVTAKGFLDKIYCGELHITGGEEEGLAVDLAKFVRANDNIYIKGNGDVQLSGKVTAGEDCINCEIEQGDFVTFVAQIVEECCGGVSIISENGMVYTADAGDALSVTVKGYSNDAKGQGVNLSGDPFNDKGLGKAAIIIISKDDLKLASGATLQAYGFYNTTGAVDDRAGVNFLDDVPPDEIPAGILRNKGVPFDVAIYLKSTGGKNPNAGQGNVTVDATVSIQSLGAGQKVCTNEGAMVIDAWDTVTFGDNFKSSIANGDVGNRLEVCSRITEWLEDAAVSPERLPYALDILNGNPLPLPFPPGYAYVLRGAGLENPDILLNFNNPDRAWVLVPSSFLVVDDVFSTSWRSGNVTGFDPASLDVLLNDGVKYQASVTDITVTTLGGTLAKVLLTDDGGATHYWGYIYTPPTDVPFVWNGVSDYASFGDTFEYQAEKVVNGVTIHSTNTATVTINVTNFLPVPGNADTTIHMVTTTNGALDAKFVLGTNPIITDIDGSPNPLVMGLGDGPTPHTGTPSISGNNVTYHPLDGYVTGGTPDSFEYTVNDESIVSATATPVVRTGTLKVAITDTLPIGSGQLPDTHMDTPLNNVSLASGGFTDAEGDTVTVGAGPYKGAVDGSTLYGGNLTTSGASYNYTPDTAEIPGYVGNDTFTVQLSDGQRNYVFDGSGNIVSNALVTSSGTVKVTLTDTLPSGGWTGTTHMDTPIINGAIPGGSFTDAEGDTVTVGSGPYKGAVDGSTLYGGNLTTSGASYNYTPDTAEIPGYVGNDKFTVQLSDGQRNYVFDGSGNIVSNALVTSSGTVKVTLTDTLPSGGWTGTTHMDTPIINGAIPGGSFTDAEGDTVTVGSGPYKGAVDGSTLYGGNLTTSGASYNYTPDTAEIPGYVGNDTFTVQLSDGQRNYVFDGSGNIVSNALVTSSGTVKVTLTDTLPGGGGDLGSTPEGTALTVTQNGVSNPVGVVDQDNGLDTLSHIIGTYNGSAGGKLEFDGTKWIYTPAPGHVGSEEFTINVWDGQNKYMFEEGKISSVEPVYGNGTVTVTVTANEINPILPAAPLPVIRLPEISGCPELMGAVAMELGINPADIQVAIGNSLTDTPDTQPCEACKKVVNYAGILKDTQGQHMAAMVQVFNQLAPANTPYSPEMGAMIANAFADYKNNPDMPQYATAMEYIDAFVKYAKVLDTELGAPVGDSTAFVLEKYGSNLTKAGNENIYMYIQTQLGKSTGGPTASLSN